MSEPKRSIFAELLHAKQEKEQVKDQEKAQIVGTYGHPQDVHNTDAQVTTIVVTQTPTNVDAYKPTNLVTYNSTKAGTKYKADRHKGNRERIVARLQIELIEEIKEFCHQNKLLVQDFIELAAIHYIDFVGAHNRDIQTPTKVGTKSSTKVDTKTPHDDLKIFKSHDDIIMLYKRMTGRRWTGADDRAGAELNSVDRRLVELGMIHTYLQARGKKINSFAYFLPEIRTVIEANFDLANIDSYLKRRREQLNNALDGKKE